MKKYRIVISALFIISVLGILSLYYFGMDSSKETEFLRVSVILDSATTDNCINLKQGMNQAASDYKVELNFVVLSGEHREQEQIELINREISNHTEAILLIPSGKYNLAQTVSLAKRKVPIATLYSGTSGDTQTFCVGVDNYQMGYDLGCKLKETRFEDKQIVVLTREDESSYVDERKRGLVAALKNTDFEMSYFNWKEQNEKLLLNQYDAAVTFDDDGLMYLVEQESKERKTKIYGMGSTYSVITALDKGSIESLLVANEYNTGYMGVQSIVEYLKYNSTPSEQLIDYIIVNQEDMFLEKNQRLLFPLMK